ncbi:hypothetical protein [Corynebacterium sp. sy039]|uniref:hypothetical protein n=1 Tax=Corynebacterium sp. sy039 TaxID=2599641 RepID=UPI0011B585D5|nr:hypothetical protein [Corynebacterium sp. sy039]QDZ43342.1 hypothetical protein FQV43_09425 [Corynebacterium sp. sy039]
MTTKTRYLAALILCLPFIAGAIYALVGTDDFAQIWSREEQPQAAPAPSYSAADAQALTLARKATLEAGSQSGFLKNGTGQLAQGTTKLADGAQELSQGALKASDSASQLADGMTQLQAGTGQLGAGATKIADGIESASRQLVGLEAIRGQLLGAIDQMLEDIKTDTDPRIVRFRDQLTTLRAQVENFVIDQNTTAQLEELKSGTRELANQLNVPGYGFHDGIYSATTGSQQLAAGLQELTSGVDQALAGVDELNDGAHKVDGLAKKTKDSIAQAQRALPAAPQQTPQAQQSVRTLAPLYAFLISAAVLLGAALRRWSGSKRTMALAVVTLASIAGGLVYLLGVGVGVGIAAASAVVAGLFVVGAALAVRICGEKLTLGLVAVQVGVVGWVWTHAASVELTAAWRVLVHLMPLHYPTAALSALANNGAPHILWVSIGVIVLFVAAAYGAERLLARTPLSSVPDDAIE